MISKKAIITSLKGLPEQLTFEELMDRLQLIEKVEHARKQSVSGKVVTHAQAKIRMKKWLK